jgi:glucose/arabinose dehydrogenase
VGSNSNAAENGIDQEDGRAAIWELELKTGNKRIFASGLRNPNGMAWETDSGALWTSVNERDELGSDLVPDFMTSVREDGFYGWPYSYYGQHVDTRVAPPRPDLVAKAIAPASAHGTSLPAQFRQGMFVGQHGSWNRQPHSGYKVIFVPFSGGQPTTAPVVDVLTGFLTAEGNAQGRPVGVALDKTGALLVADDVGNIIWRVSAITR